MLDDHQVVAVLVFGDAAGGLGLGVQGIQGQDRAGQVQSGGDVLQLGDLIGFRIDLALGAGASGSDVEDGQQVHLAAVGADGAAHGLAVRGHLGQQPGRGRPGLRGAALFPLAHRDLRQRPGGNAAQGVQVAVHGGVERLRVDLGEHPGERPCARGLDPPRPWIPAPAQRPQDLPGTACRPLSDRDRGVVPGRRERADRQPQHIPQRMPAPQRRPGIGHPAEPSPQARARDPVYGKNAGQLAGRDIDQGR